MKNIFFPLIYFLFSILHSDSCSAQDNEQSYPKEIIAQIKLVENSLSGQIKFEGGGDNLQEQMVFHKVKGLSIAVIKDYKIIWAKGYGWADESEKQPVTEKT